MIVLGDESGYTSGETQKVKLAAIEAEWETTPAPASFTLLGLPNEETQKTDFKVEIPYLLGLIATRSVDEPVRGLKDLYQDNVARIRNGMKAYADLQKMRAGQKDATTLASFEKNRNDLGYGLLLKNTHQRLLMRMMG